MIKAPLFMRAAIRVAVELAVRGTDEVKMDGLRFVKARVSV